MSAKRRERNDRTFVVVVGYTGYGHIGRKETRQPGARKRRLRVGARSMREAIDLVDRHLGSDGHGLRSAWEVRPTGGGLVEELAGKSLPRGMVVDDLEFMAAVHAAEAEPRRRMEDERARRAAEDERQQEARRRTLERKRRNRMRRSRSR